MLETWKREAKRRRKAGSTLSHMQLLDEIAKEHGFKNLFFAQEAWKKREALKEADPAKALAESPKAQGFSTLYEAQKAWEASNGKGSK